MVATSCYHSTPPDEPIVKDVCSLAISVVSDVIKVMISGDITSTNDLGLPKVAQCIKSRLVETRRKEYETCVITALD